MLMLFNGNKLLIIDNLSLGLLVNCLFRDCEICSTQNILVIASTHILQQRLLSYLLKKNRICHKELISQMDIR